MNKITVLALAVELVGIPLQILATPVTIVNGDFSLPSVAGSFDTINGPNNTTSLPGWKVNGSIDHIGNYWTGPLPGDQSLDMNGYYAAGSIQQNVQLTSGSEATVNFYLAGNPDNAPNIKTLQVSLLNAGPAGGVQSFTFSIAGKTKSNMGWVYESAMFNVLTPGTYTLEFSSVGDPNGAFGPVLADVSMSTPDGGLTVALLGFVLVGVEGLRRKLRA